MGQRNMRSISRGRKCCYCARKRRRIEVKQLQMSERVRPIEAHTIRKQGFVRSRRVHNNVWESWVLAITTSIHHVRWVSKPPNVL
jgi:hypothetical protein